VDFINDFARLNVRTACDPPTACLFLQLRANASRIFSIIFSDTGGCPGHVVLHNINSAIYKYVLQFVLYYWIEFPYKCTLCSLARLRSRKL